MGEERAASRGAGGGRSTSVQGQARPPFPSSRTRRLLTPSPSLLVLLITLSLSTYPPPQFFPVALLKCGFRHTVFFSPAFHSFLSMTLSRPSSLYLTSFTFPVHISSSTPSTPPFFSTSCSYSFSSSLFFHPIKSGTKVCSKL